MGGASGHLQHLWEDLNLTFREIKEVISNAAEGKLERVSEKLDGMNLVFTFDASIGQLKVARSSGDIKRGGMDAQALAKKFYGRGNVEAAFNAAFQVLYSVLDSLPDETQRLVFGDAGNRWYSMEIIYALDPNTINYDSNSIVFHGWPIFDVTNDNVLQSEDDSGLRILTSKIDQMQRAVGMKDWRVRGPSLLTMKGLADGSIAARATSEIDTAMASAGVQDDNTVFDYLRNLMKEEVANLALPPELARMVVERAIEAPGAPGIPQIKKAAPKQLQPGIISFLKAADELKQRMVQPIESAIHRFAIEVLRGLDSTLIAQNDKEISRIKAQVTRAIKAIESSGNQAAMEVLRREMERLGSVENIGAAMEGIVFFYKGEAYKFTGAFAPAHQILALFKYGRKGIPKMDMGEVQLRSAMTRLLREGGRSFDDVGPIDIERFDDEWPKIKADLSMLGITGIEPVGSTGKKRLMGDVDVAGRSETNVEELLAAAKSYFGPSNVTKVGANIISVRYSDPPYQLDVMVGNPRYLGWGRFGTSDDRKRDDYSPVKGAVRNLLLGIITRVAASIEFPQVQGGLDRERHIIDFDRGLFRVKQTLRNKDPNKPPVKKWRDLEREFITDDPDRLATVVFGGQTKANDLRTLEGTVAALKASPKLSMRATDILELFRAEVRNLAQKSPKALGSDPETTLNYIDKIA